jgi:predicted amidohydrolase
MIMKVGFYQFAPAFGEVQTNLDYVTNQIESLECDLLVLPEFAMTGYQFVSRDEVLSLSEPVPDGPTTSRLIELARSRNLYLVAGLPERRGNQLFNSAVLVGPQGFLGIYRKTHLFFEETLFFSLGDTGFPVWDIGMARIGILICFDWYYPEAARTLALKGADILCHPSNLVLPHCPDAMVTRCLENRVYAITANRIGQEERGGKPALRFIGKSEIVTPRGEVLHRASPEKPELIVCEVEVQEARRKSLNPFNDLWKDRKPRFYELG